MARTTATIPVGADTRQLERDIQIALSKDFKLKGLNEKAFTQPLGRITGASNEFQKSLDASNARVIAFGASAGIIYAVEKAFTDLIRTTIDVEKSLKDINVILNASAGSLKNFSNELFNIAKDTGQTFKDVASAATELARQGLGVEETLKRTRDALILTRLSGLDTVSSVEALTAAINSFSKVGLDSTTVINKLANVDAAFAVSSADLANAIQRVGSSALDAGVNFDELLAIVTSVQQTTARGGAVIGNSLKTIFTRIQRQDTLEALNSIGIAVKDLQGNTLPALSILEELAKRFDTLSDSQRSVIAEQVGGVFQINILKAALGDLSKEYSIYKNALDVSATSTDEAIKRNEELNQTVAALLNKTLANVTRVGAEVGESALKPTISNLLNTLNTGLEAITLDTNTTGGKIGKGIVEGIGTFISGPGVVLLTAIVGKLFLNLGKFALDSLKSFLTLNKAAEQRSLIQQRILDIISKEPQLIASILSKQTSVLQIENQILNTIRAQTLERQKAATIASQLTTGLMNKGVVVGRGGVLSTRTRSEGHIPEIYGALAGGYVPGQIKEMVMPGEGKVIYNTAERIKKFPGISQPAIMPPEGSDAGQRYKENFIRKIGFDPYKSQGFIPNFVPTGLALQNYIQRETSKKGLISISADEAIAAKKAGIPIKYLYGDYAFIDQKYRTSLTSLFKASEEQKAGVRATNLKAEIGAKGFSNKRPYSTYGVVFPSFSQSAPGVSAGYTTDANKQRRAYRFKTYPFPGTNFDINEKLYEDVRKNLIDTSANYFKGLITKPQIVDTNRFKTNIQSNLSRSAVESSLGQVFEAGIKASISSITLSEIANFDLDSGELSRIQKRFKLPYGGFISTIYADLKNSLSDGNLNSMARKIHKFENPSENISKSRNRFEGFIPNFSSLQSAFEAEAAMGGNPVLDFAKQVGFFVRDNKTQKTFNDVKKDHPEGLNKAIKNSKVIQRSFNRGFTPNFAPTDFTKIGQANLNESTVLMRIAQTNARSYNDMVASTASRMTRFSDAMKGMASTLDRFNQRMEGTILTLSFLGPSIVQTAAQFAPQDAKTQAKYNTASQAISYGGLGFSLGIPAAAAAAPVIGPFAAGIPIATAAAGAAYGMYSGGKQGEEMLKQEKLQSLNKELALLQDRFNQTQGALQQTVPLIDQYKRTLSLEGDPSIKQANLDIIYEKIVDSISSLPTDIQSGVLEKIKSGKFEEIGAVIAESFAKGAAEVKAKELEAYFESLKMQGGIKSKEEAKVAAKALLDVRSQETGLRYTTTLAKTEEGRKKIDDVINKLNQFSTIQQPNLKNLTNAGVETQVDSSGQLTMAKKLAGKEGTLEYFGAFMDSMMGDISKTKPKDYLADGGVPQNTEKIAQESKEAALTLQKFVDTLKILYTDADGKIAPEFQDVATKAVQIAINSGDLNAAVKFAKDELLRTKAAAGQLKENILNAVDSTQAFLDRYRADLKNLGKLTAEDIRKYMKFVGTSEEFDPGKMLGSEYDKQLRQVNLDIINQQSRDQIIKEVTDQEYLLRQKLKDRIITEDQYRNALISIIESEKTKLKRDQGLMFADQYKQERQKQREDRILAGKSVSDARKTLDVGDAFFTEFDYRTEDLYRDLQNGAVDTARTIKSEFGNAFQSIIDNSQSAEDAFRNMALNIARRIQQLALDAAVSQLFSSLFNGFGFNSLFSFSKGGPVQKYASGGEVVGGSGNKDDVLSLLTGGEYVIRKSAVNKYGTDFLNNLNSTRLPKMAEGGVIGRGGATITPTSTPPVMSGRGMDGPISSSYPMARPTSLPTQNAATPSVSTPRKGPVPMPSPPGRGGSGSSAMPPRPIPRPIPRPMPRPLPAPKAYAEGGVVGRGGKQISVSDMPFIWTNDSRPTKESIEAYEAFRNEKPYVTDAPGENIKEGGGFSYEGRRVFAYNDPFKPTAGEFIVDEALSAMAINDPNNPQVDIVQRRYDTLQNYLAEGVQLAEENRKAEEEFKKAEAERKAQIDAMNKAQRDAFNQWRTNQWLGGLAQAGGIVTAGAISTYGVPALQKAFGFGGNTNLSMWDRLFNTQKAQNYDKYGASNTLGGSKAPDYGSKFRYSQPQLRRASGGIIPKYASGGESQGDNIPALLMGGEYVINKNAVENYGRRFFDDLNRGKIPKFADGGAVGDYGYSDPYYSNENAANVNNVKQQIDQNNVNNNSITNNINISVNLTSQGGAQVSMGQSTASNAGVNNTQTLQAEINRSKDLSNKIRAEVVKVINEQQRLGGLLRN